MDWLHRGLRHELIWRELVNQRSSNRAPCTRIEIGLIGGQSHTYSYSAKSFVSPSSEDRGRHYRSDWELTSVTRYWGGHAQYAIDVSVGRLLQAFEAYF